MSSCAAPRSGSDAVPSPYPYASEPVFPKTIAAGPRGMPAHACMGLNSCRASDRFGVAGPAAAASAAGCGGGSKNGGSPAPGQSNGCAGAASTPAQADGFGGPAPAQPDGCGEPAPTSFHANACAGQGYCSTATDHTCHVQNSCRDQGGCGLYGTDDEMDRPGDNDCRSLGSCATPINAERFSTNGPNQGRSVWLRARAVFEKKWPAMRARLLEKQARGELDPKQPLPEKLGSPPAAFAETGPTYLWISDDNAVRKNMTACGSSGMSGAGGCS